MITKISDKLILIGTSHIAKSSHKEIKDVYEKYQPDVIAVELDPQRMQGLLHPVKNQKYPLTLIKQVGIIGYLFVIFGAYAQKKLGNIVNMTPGAEMKLGHDLAKEHKKKLLLVDRPIMHTLQLMKTWKKTELLKLLWDLLKSPFVKDEKLMVDLHKVPSDQLLAKILNHFKKRYPSLYKILVSSRNSYMVTNMKNYQKQFPDHKTLLIVGAGHLEGMVKLLNK